MTRDKVENLLDELKDDYSCEPEPGFEDTGTNVQDNTWDSDPGSGNNREWFEGKPSASGDSLSESTDGSNGISGSGSLTGGQTQNTGGGSSSFVGIDTRLENSAEWSKDFTVSFSGLTDCTGKTCKTRSRRNASGQEEKILLKVEDGEASVHIFSKEV